MRLPLVSGEFRTGGDVELRFTGTGKPVASVSLICTESRNTGTPQQPVWEDGDSTPWITATVWDRDAEALAETVHKGQRVLVTGSLFVREYDRKDGTKGTSVELKNAVVAPVPVANQTTRSSGPDQRDPWTTQQPGQTPRQNVPADPPW